MIVKVSCKHFSNALPLLLMSLNEGDTPHVDPGRWQSSDGNQSNVCVTDLDKKVLLGEQLPWWGLGSKCTKSGLRIRMKCFEPLQYHVSAILALEGP